MTNYDNLQEVSLAQLIQTKGWQAQYRLIIQWGTLINHKPDLRQPQHLIKGCETSAWIAHYTEENRHHFIFDSDSRVINGLAALLLSLIDKKVTSELEMLPIKALLIDAGLTQHLSPSRNTGLRAIILRAYSLAECTCLIN